MNWTLSGKCSILGSGRWPCSHQLLYSGLSRSCACWAQVGFRLTWVFKPIPDSWLELAGWQQCFCCWFWGVCFSLEQTPNLLNGLVKRIILKQRFLHGKAQVSDSSLFSNQKWSKGLTSQKSHFWEVCCSLSLHEMHWLYWHSMVFFGGVQPLLLLTLGGLVI